MDVLAGIIFWASGILPIYGILLGFFGIYLLGKGLIFIGFGLDLFSALDILSGTLILLSITANIPLMIISLISIYLMVKGISSIIV